MAENVTTRLDNLNVARQMESAGKDAKTIRLATGWERGADDKWRYEIADLEVKKDAKSNKYNRINLEDLIDAPEIFAAYPKGSFAQYDKENDDYYGYVNLDMKNITVEFVYGIINPYYDVIEKEIVLPYHYKRYIANDGYDILRTTLLHEIQHAIQDSEGFAIGANVSDEQYHNYAGEVESRNVEARHNLTPEQRREQLLRETEDVARENQIILFDELEKALAANFDVEQYDKDNGTEFGEFLNSLGKSLPQEQAHRHFHIAKTGALLNQYGIVGDITIGQKANNSSRHSTNRWHQLSRSNWIDVI